VPAARLYASDNFYVNESGVLRLSALRAAKSLQRPQILYIVMPQDVPVAAFHRHSEVGRARRVPAVLYTS
jgi:hypothetical protein